MTAKIDGISVRHAVVSDACRNTHGDRGAGDIALAQLRESYLGLLQHWPQGKDAKFHFVITVDYPRGRP